MADTVASQLIENGFKWVVYRFTNLSDGTGESAVVKVDPTSAGPLGVTIAGNTLYPGTHLRVREIEYDVNSMRLRIQWVAASPQDMVVLGGYNRLKFDKHGGIPVPSIAGANGQIQFTTVAQLSNSSYTVVMRMTKNIAQ